ncbi:hypothetical protein METBISCDRAFT_21973 [Metschnikowia bicuspidata]|uniref:CCA tRNA nucleotidyltransferase, mitochondrial n=1 Tax=Metschnikowia bicuspidata TaxID=27322 RepID=A0A4P9ZG29_9ASCO|nr:hypothetical protein METBISCDRAFT_21973 [Metschnikowia bicuspidata]
MTLCTPIFLNDTEQKILSVLTHFCNNYNKTHNEQLDLRITGGWVRDKLIGRESHDIDIAVNILSGEQFATQLLQFASENGYDLGLSCDDIHKIKKNPEKSKHLETCATKIYGLDIDFVNLRNEQYTEASRVPVVDCGTAEEDALRRDATLNAIFYNINKNEIEDWTGRGLADLQAGLLRTPLKPLQTFLDDPLRVLRLIRFAAQLNFSIEPETLHAMSDPELSRVLVQKISRERVGVELEKTLKSSNVPYGLRLINYVGLMPVLFDSGTLRPSIMKLNEPKVLEEISIREQMVDTRIDECTQLYDLFCASLDDNTAFGRLAKQVLENPNRRKQLWLLVALEPYGEISVRIDQKSLLERKYVEVVIREGLRFGRSDYELVVKLAASRGKEFLHAFFSDPRSVSRAQLGSYIREYGDIFELNLVGNAFMDVIQGSVVADQIKSDPSSQSFGKRVDPAILQQVVGNYSLLLVAIEQQNLQAVRKLKPMVDGRMVCLAFQRNPGPWMNSIRPEVVLWQLDHPDGNQKECLEHIRQFLWDK